MTLSVLTSENLRVSIDDEGAELSSIVDGAGRQLLWQGAEPWLRRAPILFPIVGQQPGGLLRYDGVDYPITQHGFARDSRFSVSAVSDSCLLFTLIDSAITRGHFPFGFRLEVRYTLSGPTLTVTSAVTNTDRVPFTASLGAHPAFAWPLSPEIARAAHTIEFAAPEPAPIRRLDGGLLSPLAFPTPVIGTVLRLDESLFVDDAIVFDSLVSRQVRYSAPGAPAIIMRFEDFPLLGVWSKIPGAFVCIEPWFGVTAPVGFSGEYTKKPHQFELAAGATRSFTYSVTVDDGVDWQSGSHERKMLGLCTPDPSAI